MAGHPTPFVNAFDHPMLDSLRYNVAQFGSPVPILWGTYRVSVNVLDGFNFKSTGSGSGKGGIGGAGKGKSGGKQYSVNVQFGFCQGPASIGAQNLVWANAGTTGSGSVPLNWHSGSDGQPPDPVFQSGSPHTPVIGYSGTFTATGTPLQLGNSPALPNISAELAGFGVGTAGDDPLVVTDANPAFILSDALTNPRYGAGYPASGPGALDPTDLILYGYYCQSNYLGFSLLMDKQQPMSSWVQELAELTISAVFYSSGRLRIVPYTSGYSSANGANYYPNLTPVYNLTDDDFLPWEQNAPGGTPQTGRKDPVQVTRSDVSQIVNWLTIEYMDRANWYSPAIQPPVFDQSSIDLYGIRSGSSIQAHEICQPGIAAFVAGQILVRKFRLRNTYQFRVGWRHMLLEPMDIVTLTDVVTGLNSHSVRINEVVEDDAGALTITAEDIV
jgi:hypothetical protein